MGKTELSKALAESVFGDEQNMIRGNFVEAGGLTHCFTGQIHICGGLHNENTLAADGGGIGQSAELQPLNGEASSLTQLIHRHKAHIVAGIFVFVAGIAQTNHDPGHRKLLLKQHKHLKKRNG